jgi:hypothetical protein
LNTVQRKQGFHNGFAKFPVKMLNWKSFFLKKFPCQNHLISLQIPCKYPKK